MLVYMFCNGDMIYREKCNKDSYCFPFDKFTKTYCVLEHVEKIAIHSYAKNIYFLCFTYFL